MPLEKGRGSKKQRRAVFKRDLHELSISRTKAGRSRTHAQNVAAAMREAFGPTKGRG